MLVVVTEAFRTVKNQVENGVGLLVAATMTVIVIVMMILVIKTDHEEEFDS
jgi:hypothetical protein